MVKALGSTGKLITVTANLNECVVAVCNEDKQNPETFKLKWGEDDALIVDQYPYLGEEISKYCS